MNVSQAVTAVRAAPPRHAIRRPAALAGVLAIAGSYALLVAASAISTGLQQVKQARASADAPPRALVMPPLHGPLARTAVTACDTFTSVSLVRGRNHVGR